MMLNRLENAFGNVASGQSLLQEFYSTSQKQDETAVAWGLRLEEILQKASEKGLVRDEDKDEMLRNKFWRSLRSDRLKNKTMVQFHKGLDFVSLRKAVREVCHRSGYVVKTAVIAWKSKYSKSIELYWFNDNGKVQRTMRLIMQVNTHNTIESQCYCCWLSAREKGSYGTYWVRKIWGNCNLGNIT